MRKAWKGASLPHDMQICRYIWVKHEKEQLSHMCRHIWKGATWKSRRSFVCSEHVLTEAGAPQTDNIFQDTIFVGYWSICQNLNIIFVEYRSICQNLNIFSNTKRKSIRNVWSLSAPISPGKTSLLGMYLFTNPAVFFNIVKGGKDQTNVKNTDFVNSFWYKIDKILP